MNLAWVRVLSLCTVMLVLAAACSGSGGGPEEAAESSFYEVNEPIVAIVPAADIAKDGSPIDPAFSFSPGVPQITVVAQAGEVTGSPMDLTWFQVTEEGEKQLFSHTVEVASFEAAYSAGESPGTLEAGTYRVKASFEGESLSTQFEVQASGNAAAALDAGAKARILAATGGPAASGPPTSGPSGAVATPVSDPSPSEAFADLVTLYAPVDPGPPGIQVLVLGSLPGGGGRVVAKATMGGNTKTNTYPLTSQQPGVSESLLFNPCAHPGGSDLPGAKAQFNASVFKGSSSVPIADVTNFTTLGPDKTKPGITINSQPGAGRVEPGADIHLDATAQENRSGPTWQTGLQSFQLTATPGGQVGEPAQASSRLPLPCARKQWSLATQGTYTVPDEPVIEICGIAEDFAGNVQTTCNKYYTGEVWEGAFSGKLFGHTPTGSCTFRMSGTFTLTVDGSGDVKGEGQFETDGNCLAPGATWEITGHSEENSFHLNFSPTNYLITGAELAETSPGHAKGAAEFHDRYNDVEAKFEMDCTSCE